MGRERDHLVYEAVAPGELKPSHLHVEEVAAQRGVRLTSGSLGAILGMLQAILHIARYILEHGLTLSPEPLKGPGSTVARRHNLKVRRVVPRSNPPLKVEQADVASRNLILADS
jgi:hypothetical protein